MASGSGKFYIEALAQQTYWKKQEANVINRAVVGADGQTYQKVMNDAFVASKNSTTQDPKLSRNHAVSKQILYVYIPGYI